MQHILKVSLLWEKQHEQHFKLFWSDIWNRTVIYLFIHFYILFVYLFMCFLIFSIYAFYFKNKHLFMWLFIYLYILI